MSSNKGGRTVLIFLILIVVILISGMSIALFFLHKETQSRKASEVLLEDSRNRNAKIETALADAETKIDVLKGKNKDYDDKINSLMSDLDLKNALSEEIKSENKKLKDLIDAESKAKEDIRQKLTVEMEAVRSKLKDLEVKEKASSGEVLNLKQDGDALRKKNDELEAKIKEMEKAEADRVSKAAAAAAVIEQSDEKNVELDPIVVTNEKPKAGRILNVDTATEFIIFDVGQKHGIKPGDVMSVYRGKTLLGEVKVTRVQEEMSAADFLQPLSSANVRKGDQVVPKL